MKKQLSIILLFTLTNIAFGQTFWKVYNSSNSPLPVNTIEEIEFDSNGDLWICTWGNGVVKYDQSTWTQYSVSNSGLTDDFVKFVKMDTNNNKWFGTWGGGIAKFDGTNWTAYTTTKLQSFKTIAYIPY